MIFIVVILFLIFIYKREKLIELARKEKILAISFFVNNIYLVFIRARSHFPQFYDLISLYYSFQDKVTNDYLSIFQ